MFEGPMLTRDIETIQVTVPTSLNSITDKDSDTVHDDGFFQPLRTLENEHGPLAARTQPWTASFANLK